MSEAASQPPSIPSTGTPTIFVCPQTKRVIPGNTACFPFRPECDELESELQSLDLLTGGTASNDTDDDSIRAEWTRDTSEIITAVLAARIPELFMPPHPTLEILLASNPRFREAESDYAKLVKRNENLSKDILLGFGYELGQAYLGRVTAADVADSRRNTRLLDPEHAPRFVNEEDVMGTALSAALASHDLSTIQGSAGKLPSSGTQGDQDQYEIIWVDDAFSLYIPPGTQIADDVLTQVLVKHVEKAQKTLLEGQDLEGVTSQEIMSAVLCTWMELQEGSLHVKEGDGHREVILSELPRPLSVIHHVSDLDRLRQAMSGVESQRSGHMCAEDELRSDVKGKGKAVARD